MPKARKAHGPTDGRASRGKPVPVVRPVAHPVAVARVLQALWRRDAFCPEHYMPTARIAEEGNLSEAEVVGAAVGLVTRKHAILPRHGHDGPLLGFYLAPPHWVADAAEERRERARRLVAEGKELDALAQSLDCDDAVAV